MQFLRFSPAILLWVVPPISAAVERVEILVREPFADGKTFGETGAYERIKGRLHYAVDPKDPADAMIVDLDLAPVDERGLVTFAGDFILLRPVDPERGNRTLLYEVNNRGGLGMLPMFNLAARSNNPRTVEHAGDGLLFEQGYTLLWSAWNWDVIAGDNRLLINLPTATTTATEGGRPLTGPVAAEFVLAQPALSAPFMWGFSKGYPPVDLDDPDAALTWRDEPAGERQVIARSAWRFSDVDTTRSPPQPTRITMKEPFVPGRIYEVVYEARDPRVVGLGLAAIRDAISFFRFGRGATASTFRYGGDVRPGHRFWHFAIRTGDQPHALAGVSSGRGGTLGVRWRAGACGGRRQGQLQPPFRPDHPPSECARGPAISGGCVSVRDHGERRSADGRGG